MTDARALFERTVSKLSPDTARPLWERWAIHESRYGDLGSILKLEARLTETLPHSTGAALSVLGRDPHRSRYMDWTYLAQSTGSALMRFAKRHVYLGLDNVVTSDLGRLPEEEVDWAQRRRGRSRSRSPTHSRSRSASQEARGKRGAEPEEPAVRGGWGRRRDLTPPTESYGRGGIGPAKRARMSDPRSPSPGGRGIPGRRRPLSPPRRPTPPPMRDDYDTPLGGGATVPEGVLFLLGILPSSSVFNGPKLDPSMLMTVIGSTELPLAGQAGPPSLGSSGGGRGHPVHPSRVARGGGAPHGRRSLSPLPSAPTRGRGGYGARRGGGAGGVGVRERSPDYQRGSRAY
jgi:cleavage stimulation factor subunit 3